MVDAIDKKIYVTEVSRLFEEPFAGEVKQLLAVDAYVTNAPGERGITKRYKPDEWVDLLGKGGVMYRYRKEAFREIPKRQFSK
jgi:hypothetical protein